MSATTRGRDRAWTAEAFLATDQSEFGDAWRYELADGAIVAHAAPSPDHGAIIAALTTAIDKRLALRPGGGCRTESGNPHSHGLFDQGGSTLEGLVPATYRLANGRP